MGLVDKIKNALFEVEYVEEDIDKVEKPKKKNDHKDKPIAKKVVLSNPKQEKHDKIEPKQDSKEIIDKVETKVDRGNRENSINNIKESRVKKNEFKVMDDNDFKVDEQPYAPVERRVSEINNQEKIPEEDVPKKTERVLYKQEKREKPLYGIDESSKNLVQDYGGAYEKKEEKTSFKPSPIISPIYGVLDKNYKKEDVKDKKEVRLSSYSRESINLDDVRKKAYGETDKQKDKQPKELSKKEESKKVVIEEDTDDSDLMVDLSKDDDKPSIKEVTMGDALEYFQDLGLEYNVDYMDASKSKATTGRRAKKNYDEEPELFAIKEEKEEVKKEDSLESDKKLNLTKKKEIDVENDDNLFDLIDSMYDEK